MPSKIVEFQKIKVRNFLSYGDDPLEITFDKGITFVTGYNKDDDSHNGVGKTSLIVESLSFLLFGETYRDINQKLIKNKYTNKTCIVEGWLKVNNDNIHIVRSASPSKLILSVNGDSVKYTKSIPETNKDIVDLIGITKTVFTNTIVMTNKESMSFLNQKKDLKVKFVEGILGLESFAEFLKLAKDEHKLAEDRRSSKFQELSLLEKDIVRDQVYFDQHEERKKDTIDNLLMDIKKLKSLQPIDESDNILKLENDVKTLTDSLDAKRVKIEQANLKVSLISADISQKNRDLSKLSEKSPVCSLCKRPFEEHNNEDLQKERKRILDEIESQNTVLAKFRKALSKINEDVQIDKLAIEMNNSVIKGLRNKHNQYIKSESEIVMMLESLDNVRNSENPFTDKIKNSKLRVDVLRKELQSLTEESKISQLIKEAASPTGIKAIVIKKVIDSLNSRINYYLSRLYSPFRIYFDEFFEENFQTMDGGEYSYGSLSGGEAKRVDFAMLFAFRDIRKLQSNVHINVTVMDEIFDSSLDAQGVLAITQLLKENTEECYMIVTHRPNIVDDTGCNAIHLIKENGITRLNSI